MCTRRIRVLLFGGGRGVCYFVVVVVVVVVGMLCRVLCFGIGVCFVGICFFLLWIGSLMLVLICNYI